MTLFQHYIITRFNLPTFKGVLRDGFSINNIDSDYLWSRFELFQKYTYPSIKNQACQNFKWLVLMDEKTPIEFKQILSKLHTEYNILIPCYFSLDDYRNRVSQDYIDKYNDYAAKTGQPLYDSIEFSEFVQRILTPIFIKDEIAKFNTQSRFIVTTRIDNDDLFHPEMIKKVQERITEEKELCMYNYSYGYQVHLNRRLLNRFYYPYNHFTTLVEDSTSLFQSVLYWNHTLVDRFVKYKEVIAEPLWVELVHGSNVSNSFKTSPNQSLLYKNLDGILFPMLSEFKISIIHTIVVDIKRCFLLFRHRIYSLARELTSRWEGRQ